MKKGKIKFFDAQKGFGFIIESESQKEIFFHETALQFSDAQKDDKVTYEESQGKKGPKALNVNLA